MSNKTFPVVGVVSFYWGLWSGFGGHLEVMCGVWYGGAILIYSTVAINNDVIVMYFRFNSFH